jgi:enoyl-CoA hydratase
VSRRRVDPPVRVEVRGWIATVTLARPATGNALDDAMMHGLVEAAGTLAGRDDLGAAIVRAEGRVFSRGLPAGVAWPPAAWPDGVDAVARMPMPVIAAVRGDASGWGLALALACDLRVVARGARLSSPEATAGGLPGGGTTQRLARLVGPGRAAAFLLLGERLTGYQAAAWGLATQAVAPAAVEGAARRLAGRLAAQGPLALRYGKEAVLRALDLPLADGVRLEHDLYVLLQTTADRSEGVRAFRARRRPRFEGR